MTNVSTNVNVKPGRVAVVTGGASGIGAAVVRRLASSGATVAILDLERTKLDAWANELTAAVPAAKISTHPVDVRRVDDVKGAFAAVRKAHGPVEILVNCVGGSTPQRPVEEISDEEWDAVLTLNLRGLFYCTREAVPDMKRARYGRIVNVSSLAGRTRSLFGGAHYTASKAGVIGFSRQVAYECAPFGIAVNVVAPGVTLSERVQKRWDDKTEEDRNAILSLIPAARAATPDEPAAAVCFLCSEDAGYINGSVVDVNGGMYIG